LVLLEFFQFQFKKSCFSIYFRKEDNNSGKYNILFLKFLFYVKCMREKINHSTTSLLNPTYQTKAHSNQAKYTNAFYCLSFNFIPKLYLYSKTLSCDNHVVLWLKPCELVTGGCSTRIPQVFH